MRFVAVCFLAVGLMAAPAGAKEKDIQHHEIDGNIDLNIVSLGNEAIFGLKYVFTFEGIDRNDEIPPILRRFLLHPTALWFDVSHDGGTRDAITNLQIGGEVYPFDGLVYVRAEGGFGRHLTIFDEPAEFGYFYGTVYGEVGFRPVQLIQLGAFYRGSPIIEEDLGSSAQQAQRTGTEQSFGGIISFATPNDRLYGTVSAFGVVNDWTFQSCPVCLYPGGETVRGFGASLRLAFQLTSALSLQISGQIERDHWVDNRADETTHLGIAPDNLDLDRQVWNGQGTGDFIYWYMGKYGFRLSVGGGYQMAPPLFAARSTAIIRFGGGVTMRF